MSRPSRHRAERVYGLVVALYPRAFRERHGPAMRLVFRDLLDDPEISAWRIWLSVLGDLRGSVLHEHLANLMGGLSMTRERFLSSALVRSGAMFGCAVLLIWITFRSFHLFGGGASSPQGWDVVRDNLRLAAPWLLFVSAGYVGARTSGTFSGGIRAGLVAGAIAALTIPGDYVLFHREIPGGVVPTAFVLLASSAVAMFFAAVGAALGTRNGGLGMSQWAFRLGPGKVSDAVKPCQNGFARTRPFAAHCQSNP
jgi:hypothetical protein